MQPEVKMFLDDPEKSVVLGIPESKRKIVNPFYEATQLEQAGDRKQAERIYLELLNADFENPVICAALGMNYAVAEKNGIAHLLLQKALAGISGIMDGFKRLGITPKGREGEAAFLTTKHSEILNAIGTCYKHENKTEEARRFFVMAQKLIPLNPDIQNNMGTLYINEGNPKQALIHLEQALSVDPNHPQAHWNKSLAYLEQGEYAKGWAEYDWGTTAHVRVERNYGKEPVPFWDGTKGKRVVVYGEQGIGDEILFASMLNELRQDCTEVVFDCHRKLHKLFANSFPGMHIYPTREDEVITWPLDSKGNKKYNFDAKIAIGSLGKFYRPDLASFPGTPFLSPTPSSESEWAKRLEALGPRPKIGLSWIGGHKRTRIEVRSMELEKLLPILKDRDCDFISLQYTPCEDELAAFEKVHGIKIHHWPEACYSPDYDETAGLVANLDLVITVCTSLVHLAGSMGVPTWVMTPSRPAWRYRLDLDTMPWYGNTVLFRQKEGSTDWAPVVAEVADNLSTLLGAPHE